MLVCWSIDECWGLLPKSYMPPSCLHVVCLVDRREVSPSKGLGFWILNPPTAPQPPPDLLLGAFFGPFVLGAGIERGTIPVVSLLPRPQGATNSPHHHRSQHSLTLNTYCLSSNNSKDIYITTNLQIHLRQSTSYNLKEYIHHHQP